MLKDYPDDYIDLRYGDNKIAIAVREDLRKHLPENVFCTHLGDIQRNGEVLCFCLSLDGRLAQQKSSIVPIMPESYEQERGYYECMANTIIANFGEFFKRKPLVEVPS